MGLFLSITGLVTALAVLAYSGLILYFFFGWKKLRQQIKMDDQAELLPVSVIVTARNEEENILNLMEDLARQDHPIDLLEVLIVDDGSGDKTFHVVQTFIIDHNLLNFKIIRRIDAGGMGSKKKALTLGLAEASGEIILTTDADCRVSAGWVSSMVRPFSDEKIRLTAGPVSYEGYKSFSGKFQSLEFLGLVASGAGAIGAGQPFLCNGACMAYRKKTFLEVEGYSGNEKYRSGDDVFLMHKIKQTFGSESITFVMEKSAMVKTRPVNGFFAFIRQRARWASKSSGYRDSMSLMTAGSVFSMAVVMSAYFIAGFIYPLSFLFFGGMVMIKALVDFPLLSVATKFTGDRPLMKWLLLFEAVYPFYVIIAGIFGIFRRKQW